MTTTRTTDDLSVWTIPVSSTRPRTPGALTDQLEQVVDNWATSQYELVTLAAEFADSTAWG